MLKCEKIEIKLGLSMRTYLLNGLWQWVLVADGSNVTYQEFSEVKE